jgi:hypothetical protein
MAIMAPFGAPLKRLGLQGKCRRVPGSVPLWGQQWTRLLSFHPAPSTATTGHDFPHHAKYCQNGGMAFAHHPASACQGVQDGDDGPFVRPLERAVMQGKRPWGPGSAPFGGRNGLVCLSASYELGTDRRCAALVAREIDPALDLIGNNDARCEAAGGQSYWRVEPRPVHASGAGLLAGGTPTPEARDSSRAVPWETQRSRPLWSVSISLFA